MEYGCGPLINNKWCQTGTRMAVTNPYDGAQIAEIDVAGQPEADAAVR
ncbi:MAG: hypothetical protein GY850_46250, partial [bacterium]|nr:hypothetical protein [bacterium]